MEKIDKLDIIIDVSGVISGEIKNYKYNVYTLPNDKSKYTEIYFPTNYDLSNNKNLNISFNNIKSYLDKDILKKNIEDDDKYDKNTVDKDIVNNNNIKFIIKLLFKKNSNFYIKNSKFIIEENVIIDGISNVNIIKNKKNKEIDIVKKEIQELEKNKKDLEKNKKDLEKNKEELEKNKEGLEKNKEDLEKNKEELEKNKKDLEKNKKDLEKNKKDLEKNKKDLEKNKEELEKNKEGLEKNKEDLEKINNNIIQLEKKINEMKEKLKKINDIPRRALNEKYKEIKKNLEENYPVKNDLFKDIINKKSIEIYNEFLDNENEKQKYIKKYRNKILENNYTAKITLILKPSKETLNMLINNNNKIKILGKYNPPGKSCKSKRANIYKKFMELLCKKQEGGQKKSKKNIRKNIRKNIKKKTRKNIKKKTRKNIKQKSRKNIKQKSKKTIKKKSIVGGNKHIETLKEHIKTFKQNPKKYIGHPSKDFELCKTYNKKSTNEEELEPLTIKNLPEK